MNLSIDSFAPAISFGLLLLFCTIIAQIAVAMHVRIIVGARRARRFDILIVTLSYLLLFSLIIGAMIWL